jgi:hypothetical protein
MCPNCPNLKQKTVEGSVVSRRIRQENLVLEFGESYEN